MLELKRLTTHYGQIRALKGVNITINRGEIVTLIGANGAGKSTLLNTVCGNPRLTSGKILYQGQDIGQLSQHKIAAMGISLVPEGRRIFSGLTIEENLELGGFHRT